MHRSDKELLLDYAHRGDVDALSVLVKRHETWMMAFLRNMLSHADADDAFQQVWIQVIKSVDAYHGGDVKSYLTRIARNEVMLWFRALSRIPPMIVPGDEETNSIDNIPYKGLSPLDEVESKSNAHDVRRAVKSLPAEEREVLMLRIECDMKIKEIAEVLQRPIGTALSQMHRAIARLKRVLGVGTFKEAKESV